MIISKSFLSILLLTIFFPSLHGQQGGLTVCNPSSERRIAHGETALLPPSSSKFTTNTLLRYPSARCDKYDFLKLWACWNDGHTVDCQCFCLTRNQWTWVFEAQDHGPGYQVSDTIRKMWDTKMGKQRQGSALESLSSQTENHEEFEDQKEREFMEKEKEMGMDEDENDFQENESNAVGSSSLSAYDIISHQQRQRHRRKRRERDTSSNFELAWTICMRMTMRTHRVSKSDPMTMKLTFTSNGMESKEEDRKGEERRKVEYTI